MAILLLLQDSGLELIQKAVSNLAWPSATGSVWGNTCYDRRAGMTQAASL